jgi:hypothetical protein
VKLAAVGFCVDKELLREERKMKKRHFVTIACMLTFVVVSCIVSAADIRINPTNDGYIHPNGSVNTSSYVMVTNSYRGIMVFSTSPITEEIAHASLSINPYATPVWIKQLAVYAYQKNDSEIVPSDYSAGVFLGYWSLPEVYTHGQDDFFDVTQFMQGVSSSFVGFNLRAATTGATDVFSSLEYNYGHPSQLTIALVPEPATMLLLCVGGVMVRKR